MPRKKPTKTQQTRRNVQRAVKRAEERGYRFSDEFKEEIKQASYQKLKSIQAKGYRGLYTQASYLDQENDEIITGWQARLNELSAAAKKGAETKTFEEPKTVDDWIKQIQQTPTEWRRYIRQKTAKDKKATEQRVIQGLNDVGNVLFRNIVDIVKENLDEHEGATVLLNWINARLNAIGPDKLQMVLAFADDSVKENALKVALMDSDQLRRKEHIPLLNSMTEILNAGKLTVEQAKLLGRSFEHMEGTD